MTKRQATHAGLPAGHDRRIAPLFSLRWVLCFFIRIYRLVLSPAQTFLFGADSGCRFTPTCSQYALEAIGEHGAMTGSLLAVRRICRCHPFGSCGHDPVPKGPAWVEVETHHHL